MSYVEYIRTLECCKFDGAICYDEPTKGSKGSKMLKLALKTDGINDDL